MAVTTQTSTVYAAIPRARHGGPNIMDGGLVSAVTTTVSTVYFMFHLPPDCVVIRGHVKGSFPSGVSGQMVAKLGTDTLDSMFATFTISGGAANPGFAFYGPFTLTSSGTNGLTPVIVNVNTAPSSTKSLSLYVLIEYVLPGNSQAL